ncbi:MAG: hypothetical protein AABZ47_04490 [Planctomycetota bacterium]
MSSRSFEKSTAIGLRAKLAFTCVAIAIGNVANLKIAGAITVSPQADGTLADGGNYGSFDGVADDWDWSFNQSSYEGTITLNRGSDSVNVEHRVVFEYNLATIPTSLPITAKWTVLLRGAPRFPAADTDFHVYSYPADLLENPTDFNKEPAKLIGSTLIAPFQSPTYRTFDASRVVNDTLGQKIFRVAFRCQVNPATFELLNQVFIDAVDSEPQSKPTLTVDLAVPGDSDLDRDVDPVDFRAFTSCFAGPGTIAGQDCRIFDFDLDSDVDLMDFESFQFYRSFFFP